MRRVVVTGMGIASPLGSTVKSAFDRLKKYENCIEHWDRLDEYERLNTSLGCFVSGFEVPEHFTRKVRRTMGQVSLMATVTAEEALRDAGLLGDDIVANGRTGVSYGSSTGSLDAILDFYSMCIDKEVKLLNSGSYIKMMPQTAAVNISLYFKTHGRLIPTSTACTSGAMGIGYAYEAIKDGYADVMISGGAEEIHPTQVGVFDTLYATSSKNDTPKLTPSPFDKNRDGLVIGEGAGTLILEEYERAKARGAKIYAEIAGFATNTDGTHITNPNKDMMAEVMRQSLNCAGVSANEIGYVNAHGTGTVNGDIAESLATETVFGQNIPISTIKSYTGHTLGACGAIEAILSIEMMNDKWFAPTLNLNELDENCGQLDYIMKEGRIIDTEYVMTNNFAFGGINTSIILKRV